METTSKSSSDNKIVLDTKGDHVLKEYLKENTVFADFMNSLFFGGKRIFHEGNVFDVDSDCSTVIELNGKIISIGKIRDIIKLINIDGVEFYIAIELQGSVDYQMVYRNYLYDAITYNQQINREIGNKSYCPLHVYTFVIHHGERKWLQPFFMSDREEKCEVMKDFHFDAGIIVGDLKDADASLFEMRENQLIVETVQKFYKWNKKVGSLEGIVLKKKSAIIVATLIGDTNLERFIIEKDEEEIVMCTALREFVEEGEARGRADGETTGKALCIKELMRNLKLTFEQAVKALNVPEEEHERYRNLVLA